MRALMSLSLIVVLSLCPAFCGAEEADHGTHRHGTAGAGSTSDEAPSSPAHCPEDGDNCICQGAIQSGDVRLPDSDVLGLPLHALPEAHAPSHPLAHLTWEGSPTGLAGWGDSLDVRAFLQNFRC